jgi:hypothetical protein
MIFTVYSVGCPANPYSGCDGYDADDESVSALSVGRHEAQGTAVCDQ